MANKRQDRGLHSFLPLKKGPVIVFYNGTEGQTEPANPASIFFFYIDLANLELRSCRCGCVY